MLLTLKLIQRPQCPNWYSTAKTGDTKSTTRSDKKKTLNLDMKIFKIEASAHTFSKSDKLWIVQQTKGTNFKINQKTTKSTLKKTL